MRFVSHLSRFMSHDPCNSSVTCMGSQAKKPIERWVFCLADVLRVRIAYSENELHTDKQFVITFAPRLEVAQSKRGDRVLSEWEVQRVKYHYDIGIASPCFGYVIDNSDMTIDETVQTILQRIGRVQ